jgi:2-dehydro-3-deoxygalactonokinase
MRGEETEVVGCLCEAGQLGPLLYIHLGSHTKVIRVDESNRIAGGLSTLAGELLAAVQNDTILRDSLPPDLNIAFDKKSLFHGWVACRRFGLSRALYLVRILHLNSDHPKEWLASFLLGAMLSEDFRCLDSLRSQFPLRELIVSGLPHLQPAWSSFLKPLDLPFRMLNAEETEQAFLKGAQHILSLRLRH